MTGSYRDEGSIERLSRVYPPLQDSLGVDANQTLEHIRLGIHTAATDYANDLINQGRLWRSGFVPTPHVVKRDDTMQLVLRNDPYPMAGVIMPVVKAHIDTTTDGGIIYRRSSTVSHSVGKDSSEHFLMTASRLVYYGSRSQRVVVRGFGTGEAKLSSDNPEDIRALETKARCLQGFLERLLGEDKKSPHSAVRDLSENILT